MKDQGEPTKSPGPSRVCELPQAPATTNASGETMRPCKVEGMRVQATQKFFQVLSAYTGRRNNPSSRRNVDEFFRWDFVPRESVFGGTLSLFRWDFVPFSVSFRWDFVPFSVSFRWDFVPRESVFGGTLSLFRWDFVPFSVSFRWDFVPFSVSFRWDFVPFPVGLCTSDGFNAAPDASREPSLLMQHSFFFFLPYAVTPTGASTQTPCTPHHESFDSRHNRPATIQPSPSSNMHSWLGSPS